MRKQRQKSRDRDVRLRLKTRCRSKGNIRRKHKRNGSSVLLVDATEQWIKLKANKLNLSIDRSNRVTIHLPAEMDFSTNYNKTLLYFMAIRRLVRDQSLSAKRIRLKRVDMDQIQNISTSAALALTAELARWEDSSTNKLTPNVESWNEDVYSQFHELGFFDLFERPPGPREANGTARAGRHLVRYIKGSFRDHRKPRILQERLREIVGDEIDKWSFLHSGLVEAIINVTHHAYPDSGKYIDRDKNWYLTGSYDKSTRQLKIVFYDQGIGIPKSLPATKPGEKILEFASRLSLGEGLSDPTLLAAAFTMSRTSTQQSDRGKGLQDIVEFVRQRKQGYLAVVSGYGIFKIEVNGDSEKSAKLRAKEPMSGTLIVWSVTLEKTGHEK